MQQKISPYISFSSFSFAFLPLSASEMTYIVSSGALNSTHSLTLPPLPSDFPIGIPSPSHVPSQNPARGSGSAVSKHAVNFFLLFAVESAKGGIVTAGIKFVHFSYNIWHHMAMHESSSSCLSGPSEVQSRANELHQCV